MARSRFSPMHSIAQRVASSRSGARFFSRTQHYLDRATFSLSRGRTTVSTILSGLPVIMLTTTGAKSGALRTVPLLGIRKSADSPEIAFIATNWGQKRYPAWYYNLKANPRAICAINKERREYEAHEAAGNEYAQYWDAATETYFGYTLYGERIEGRHIPIMIMSPIDGP